MHTKIEIITHKKDGNTHKKKILNKVVIKILFFPKTPKNTQKHTKIHKNTQKTNKKCYKIVNKLKKI